MESRFLRSAKTRKVVVGWRRKEEANGARGDRVGSVETSEDRLHQLISTRLQSVMTSVLSQVNEKHNEVKTMLNSMTESAA